METQTSPTKQVRLAGALSNRPRHICAFFNGRDEEYRVMLPFIKEGFDQGHRAFHVVDSRRPVEHLRVLEESGIDVDRAQRDGQLQVRRWDEAYLKDGYFDPERMLSLIENALKDGAEQGYESTRVIANMDWALGGKPGIERRRLENVAARGERLGHPVLGEVDRRTLCLALVRRHLAEGREQRGDRALLAERCDADGFERGLVAGGGLGGSSA